MDTGVSIFLLSKFYYSACIFVFIGIAHESSRDYSEGCVGPPLTFTQYIDPLLMSAPCPGPGRGVGVCNEQGDRQQQAAVQMFLRNHGLQGQH